MRRPLGFWFAVFLAGCDGTQQEACDFSTAPPPPQDCATLSRESWRVGPFPTSSETELRLEVGQSRALFLNPFVEPQCADSIASVAWSVDEASGASVVAKDPAYRGAWVTGLAAGANAVRAHIAFRDGATQTAPRAVQVVAREPAGQLVAEGTVDLDATGDSRRYVPFTLPRAASRTEIRVDWASPLNSLSFAFFQGDCTGPAGAACVGPLRFIAGNSNNDVKPLALSEDGLPADIYTLRLDNLGPGAETVRYEVRMTP